ncbi:oligopeptidase B [Caulobacter ginsengisoli]|uniref:Oligopeptidase B n=1 Tax=Caulobacter ginsengisoli TaxID=400775 RepID=A0ABU0IR92_9CAUL|nr:oligopeptidase B [Caulobacter ginsengisoli]
MNRRQLILTASALPFVPGLAMAATPVPPIVRKDPKRIEQLGRVRVDEYAWMKDDNWQNVLHDPSLIKAEVKAHLLAENAYFKAMMAPTEPLQAKMFEEMKGRIKEDDASVPVPDGPWEYYTRFEKGAQQAIHARRPRGKTDGEQILLNEEVEKVGKAFYHVDEADNSPDHGLYAWMADEQGSEVYRLYVKDLATGAVLPEPIESVYGFCWSPDSKFIFWVLRDENGRPAKVYRRPARGGKADDVLIHDEQDEGFFISVYPTASRQWVVLSLGEGETSEMRLIPAGDPTATPAIVEPRSKGVLYDIDHWGEEFIIRTNADGAIDFKLVKAPVASPGKAHWKDWVPYKPGRLIEGGAAFKDHFVRQEKSDALSRLVVTDRAGKETPLAFEEETYALTLQGGMEYGGGTMRFVYESPTTPKQWFDYDLASAKRTLRKTQEIPSGHDPSRYVTRRLNAKAADGAEVPIFVLMKKDTKLDGQSPLMLYGYGSYGSSQEPTFSIRNFSLVDRGWIWAQACVRGGSEKGWGWFQDGRKFKKKNSFSDFVACADHLHAAGYGAADRTVAYGRSAGGLLMGGVTNLAPEKFAGIIAGVPFVDVINTMSDTSLPLTPPEWPEWGDPIKDPAAYDYMMSYSPYDNVAAKPYPAVLAYAGLSDPRVTYWEPEKWTQRLRTHTTSGKPILLWVNMEAGHAGSSGRFDYLKETARDLAFAVWAVDKGWLKA